MSDHNSNPQDKIFTISSEDKPRHSVCSAVWRFLSFIGATLTFIRNLIANAVMVLVILFIVIAYNAASSFKEEITAVLETGAQPPDQTAAMMNSKVMIMDLAGPISAAPLGNSGFANLQRQIEYNLNGTATHELLAIERALSLAKDDDSIECVLLLLDDMGAVNLAEAKRIAAAAAEVRDAGKRVIASAMSYSQASYIIAAAASEIALDPIGEINLRGISMQTLYYRDLLDKAMITPYVFRAGHFKSAVEPYLLNGMSDDVKAEYQELANLLWSDYERTAGEHRPILSRSSLLPPDLSAYVRSLSLYHGDKALMQYESNLADLLYPKSEVLRELADKYGADPDYAAYPNAISYQDYLSFRAPKKQEKGTIKVAVLYGIGSIVSIPRNEYTFAPDNLIPLMDEIAADGDYKAAVLYIDSPGGLVEPSEMIRRKILELREQGIPVYISINGTGASGAYMISSAGSKIVATSDSLVGSIGVFAVSFGLHNLLNYAGVSQDGVTTSDIAETNIAKPLSMDQLKMLQLSVDNTYRRFIDEVAEGRGISREEYLDYAEGQVFTAGTAENLGLIDKVGTFEDTLELIASDLQAAREDLQVEHLVRQDNPSFSMFEELFLSAAAQVVPLKFLALMGAVKEQEEILFADENEIIALSAIGAPKL